MTDFVCPTEETRAVFFAQVENPVFVIWMNTIEKSRYEDTNKLFVAPTCSDLTITTLDQTTTNFTAIMTAIQEFNRACLPM